MYEEIAQNFIALRASSNKAGGKKETNATPEKEVAQYLKELFQKFMKDLPAEMTNDVKKAVAEAVTKSKGKMINELGKMDQVPFEEFTAAVELFNGSMELFPVKFFRRDKELLDISDFPEKLKKHGFLIVEMTLDNERFEIMFRYADDKVYTVTRKL